MLTILPMLVVLSLLQFHTVGAIIIRSTAALPLHGFLVAGANDGGVSLASLEPSDIIEFASGIFAVFLMALTFLSYINVRATRLLFVAGAFGLFAVRAIMARLDIFIPESLSTGVETGLALAGFAILSLFFLAIVKKGTVRP